VREEEEETGESFVGLLAALGAAAQVREEEETGESFGGLLGDWQYTTLALPSGGSSGQRACYHAQLGAPRHGPAVFFGTPSAVAR
jgi:hypothetical protein